MRLNSHGTDGEKCVEIVKTLHVKFFPLGAPAPNRTVTVKYLESQDLFTPNGVFKIRKILNGKK